MSYDITDVSERNFARAEDKAACFLDSIGFITCPDCGTLTSLYETEHIHKLIADMKDGKAIMRCTVAKLRVCRSCAPRCTLCDGLMDHGSLFEDSFQRTQDEMNVGMGVMVVTSQGKMHGGCAAAFLLGESDGEDLALLSKDEISRRVA